MADVDPLFLRQIFDISERKQESHVRHERQPAEPRATMKILEWVGLAHDRMPRRFLSRLNRNPSDSTIVTDTVD